MQAKPTGRRRFLAVSLVRVAVCLLLSSVVMLHAGRAGASSRLADYFIVERVGALRIYDHFQQPVRDPGREGVLPYTPFKIIAWQSVMGDGLTSCSIVELHGNRYFLLRDSQTRLLIGENSAGNTLTLRGAEILDDTLVVTAVRGVELLPPGGSTSIRLTTGDRLVRLFRWHNKIYGHADRTGGVFGWVTLPAGAARAATPAVNEQAATGIPPSADILSRVRTTVDETNSTLRRLYTFLDAESGSHREPPQWSVERKDGSILCLLRSAPSSAASAESSAQLAKRIEGRLLGTGYSILHQPGRIEIHP